MQSTELPSLGAAERPRDEPPGQPGLVSPRNRQQAGRVGSIELLGAWNAACSDDVPVVPESCDLPGGDDCMGG